MKIWGCKVDELDPKEKSCSIHFGFVLLQLVLIPKFLHICVCKKAASLLSLTRTVQLSRYLNWYILICTEQAGVT